MMMIENIKYVLNFLKFGLYQYQLSKDTEDERQTSMDLLNEVLQNLDSRRKMHDSVYVSMGDCMTEENGISDDREMSCVSIEPKLSDPEYYIGIPVDKEATERAGSSGNVNDIEDDIYVSMTENGQSNKNDNIPLPNTDTRLDEDNRQNCVNQSECKQMKEDVKQDNSLAVVEASDVQEDTKLFLTARDIEEKWRKLSSDMTNKCDSSADAEIEGEAIKTLNTLKKKSSVYIKKNCFCFGYLHRRRRRFIGPKWEKVYAVMKKNVMFLYKSEFDEKSMEVVILNGYDIATVEERNGKAGFQLTPITILDSESGEPRPIHRFRCNIDEFDVWQKALLFPERKRNSKSANQRETAWLKIAPSFDNAVSDEHLQSECNTSFEDWKGRERSHTEESCKSTSTANSVNECLITANYRPPCPLPVSR